MNSNKLPICVINYPELEAKAALGGEAYTGTQKFNETPDLENFRLARFSDLRKKTESLKLMLFGSNQTNISVNGPDSPLDEFIHMLPNYIGKSWSEIKNMPRD